MSQSSGRNVSGQHADEHDWRNCVCEECYFERKMWLEGLSFRQRFELLGRVESYADELRNKKSPIAFMFEALETLMLIVPHS